MNYNMKNKKQEKILTAFFYAAATACMILGAILLIRQYREPQADIIETVTEPTTASVHTITETLATTAATTAPISESAPLSDSEQTASETQSATTFSAPSASDLDYDKTFFDKYLFIGDSISTGLFGYNFLPAENVFAKQGFTPNNIPEKEIDGLTVIKKASEMNPETIVIMLGTNGLSYIDTGVMAKAYGTLIDSLTAASPDSKIVILSIPPVTKKHEEEKPENLTIINDYNEKLNTLAEDKGAVFIDINTILAGEGGYTADIYAEADGLHLKGEAYKRILSEIEETLSETE
jgi:lysophospholipase L1-like esterase